MGQTVLASQDVLDEIKTNDLVSVYGSVAGPGYLYADAVEIEEDQYVPGSTELVIAGVPSSVDRISGTLKMGGISVNYNALLAVGAHPTDNMLAFQGVEAQPGSKKLTVHKLLNETTH